MDDLLCAKSIGSAFQTRIVFNLSFYTTLYVCLSTCSFQGTLILLQCNEAEKWSS